MRRLVLLCFGVLVVLPATAFAFQPLTAGDGTLSVRNGDGFIGLRLRSGVILGRVESGRIEVVDPDVDCADLRVWDAEDRDRGFVQKPGIRQTPSSAQRVPSCVFKGEDMSLRLLDQSDVRIKGTGLWLSVVGRGRVILDGYGTPAKTRDGQFALNGGKPQSLPDDRETFVIEGS